MTKLAPIYNYKSIFVLHIYAIQTNEDGLAYRIDQEELKTYGSAPYGFPIFEALTAYYETLAEAETYMKKHSETYGDDLYGFVIEEKPLNYANDPTDNISVRRYLKNGDLWQKSEISSITEHFDAEQSIGETRFYGRDPKTIAFNVGDIVEIVDKYSAYLAIIKKLPPTIDQVKEKCEQDKNLFPDRLQDKYCIEICWADKDGKKKLSTQYKTTVDVLPPSLPVPQNLEAELHRLFKKRQEG